MNVSLTAACGMTGSGAGAAAAAALQEAPVLEPSEALVAKQPTVFPVLTGRPA